MLRVALRSLCCDTATTGKGQLIHTLKGKNEMKKESEMSEPRPALNVPPGISRSAHAFNSSLQNQVTNKDIPMIFPELISKVAACYNEFFSIVIDVHGLFPRIDKSLDDVVGDALFEISTDKELDPTFSPESIEEDAANEMAVKLLTALLDDYNRRVCLLAAGGYFQCINDAEAECLCDQSDGGPVEEQIPIIKFALVKIAFDTLKQAGFISDNCELS